MSKMCLYRQQVNRKTACNKVEWCGVFSEKLTVAI